MLVQIIDIWVYNSKAIIAEKESYNLDSSMSFNKKLDSSIIYFWKPIFSHLF